MTHETLAALGLLALAFALVALGLAIFALWRTRGAVNLAHAHRRLPPGPIADDRQVNLGAPRATGERRSTDLGPSARHRHPDDERSTRRQAYGLREGHDDDAGEAPYPPPPTAQPVEPAATEHAPPTADMRRLPPPGSITR